MIVGLISDTHGLLREKVIEGLSDCDLIIHAGDIGKNNIISRLQDICEVEYVYGNIDQKQGSKISYKIVNVEKTSIYIIHNITDINIDLKKEDINIVIYGHSHKNEVYEKNNILYINPGSIGPKRFKLTPMMAKLYINEVEEQVDYEFGKYMVKFVEIDTKI